MSSLNRVKSRSGSIDPNWRLLRTKSLNKAKSLSRWVVLSNVSVIWRTRVRQNCNKGVDLRPSGMK